MPDRSFLLWPFFDDAHRALAGALDAWAERELASLGHPADRDGVDALSRELVRRLAAGGWLAHAVPAPFGGKSPALDVRSLCLIRETLARRHGLADFAFAMQGLGAGPISLAGSEAQKRRWLPAVARGEAIAAFALSEAEAGSDVAALATTARRDGESWILDGEKTWISNGGIADLHVVFARSGEGPGAKGLSAFVVPGDAPGFDVAARIDTIAPHPLGTLRLRGCRVPAANLIGAPGDGFRIAMATLDVFRATVGAAALGLARRALDEALARVEERRVFGQPLKDFQLSQAKLAAMATEIDAAALLVYRAAWDKDAGAARVTREASMAKWYATEAAQRAIDAAVQLHGALGVVAGHPVETLYREIRSLRIYEGTSEIQQLVIAGQVLAAHAAQGAARKAAE